MKRMDSAPVNFTKPETPILRYQVEIWQPAQHPKLIRSGTAHCLMHSNVLLTRQQESEVK